MILRTARRDFEDVVWAANSKTNAHKCGAPAGPFWAAPSDVVLQYYRQKMVWGALPSMRQKLLRCPCLAPMFSQARHGAADPRWPLAQPPLQRSFGIGGHGNGPRSPELKRSDGVVLDRSLGSQWPFALATCGVALPGDSESTGAMAPAKRRRPPTVAPCRHHLNTHGPGLSSFPGTGLSSFPGTTKLA